ncbi:MAG TPA: hypothetical protein VFO86_08755, partial [Terriglobia bacterium]|nr:hypothetical protein [Terriglobia bacterium]
DGVSSYTFNIVPVHNELNPVPLVFGETVSESIDEQGETDSYTFNLVAVSNELNPVPLVLGGTVSEAIDEQGETDSYTFSLASGSMLYFDMLSPNDGNFIWSLIGPAGTVISGRAFTGSDSHDIGNPVLNLIAGNYTLIVDGNGDTIGSYSFRLLNLADATSITPGTPVDSTLNPGQETDLYRFNGTAGDLFYFDVTARNGGGNAQWSLVDKFGNLVFDRNFSDTANSDAGPLSLPSTGTYTLMIEGSRFDGVSSYSFNLVHLKGEAPIVLQLTPLTSVFWDGGGDGVSWNDPLNWSGNVLPGAHSAVRINMPGTFTIALTSDVQIGSLVIDGSTGTQTLNFGTHQLNTGGALTVTSNGVLNVGTGALISGTTLTNGGSIFINNGTIAAGNTQNLPGGVLSGSGTVTSNIVNNGSLLPGLLTIQGNLTQTPFGQTQIDIAGTAPGQFDKLSVDGTAALDGTLKVNFIDGFVPAVGDSFNFLTFTTSTGTFAHTQSQPVGLSGSLSGSGFSINVASVTNGPMAWTGSGDGVSWNDPLNWSLDRTPTPLDDVTIDVSGEQTIVIAGAITRAHSLATSEPLRIVSTSLVVTLDLGLVNDLTLENGSVEVPFLQMNLGTLRGNGTIIGNLVNSSIVSPGASPGLLTINGNFTQNLSGTLVMEIAGTLPATVDRIAVTGTAILDGKLKLIVDPAFVPPASTVINLLSYITHTGEFFTYDGFVFSGGRFGPRPGLLSYGVTRDQDPIANNDTVTTLQNTLSATFDVLANDVDPGDTLN